VISAPSGRSGTLRSKVLGTGHFEAFGNTLVTILIGFAIVVLILLIDGFNPISVFYKAARGSLWSRSGILQTLAGTTPLLLTSITFAIGYRCGLFNISAEGAMMMGAAATIATGAYLDLPPGFHHGVVLGSAMAAGIVWSIPVAYLKTERRVHEVVSTIMMNWTALFFIGFLIAWPLRDLGVAYGTFAVRVSPSARFPLLVSRSPLTLVLLIGIAFALIVYAIMWYTRSGQHIRATGFDMDAARGAGVNTSLMMAFSFAIGGASAGLAGCALTAGTPPLWTVTDELSGLIGMGFLGIAVAMIGRNHAVWCILAAFFVSAVRTSRFYIQQIGVAPEITDVLIGVIIFSFALPETSRVVLKQFRKLKERGERKIVEGP
jgi:simple sugar transport system permease protein